MTRKRTRGVVTSNASRPSGNIIIDASLSPNRANLAILASGAAIVFGAAFQLGYFSNVGLEFVQLAGPLDILYVAAFMMPFFIVLYPLFRSITEAVDSYYDSGSSQLVAFSFSWVRYEYHALALAFSILILFGVNTFTLFQVAGFVVSLVLCLLNWAAIKRQYYEFDEISPSSAFWFSLNAFIALWIAGALYATNVAGRECFIRTSGDTFWQARYLRAIGGGHLLRFKDQTIYLAQGELKEMFCGGARSVPNVPLDSKPSDRAI